jgi:phosphopantothenoylcysteine synthetase/decarboxylase
VGDSVLHIDLAKRNHLLLFAPLCAHSLAQLAGGSAGTLALSVARAWASDLEECFAGQVRERCGRHCVEKPLVVAPAMNTVMWHQNVTQEHLSVLRRRKVVVVDPVEKVLACGDRGRGAMAEPHDIADLACQLLDAHEEALAAARCSGLPEFLP